MIEELKQLMAFRSITSDQNAVDGLLDYTEGRLLQKNLNVERFTVNGVHSLYASTLNTYRTELLLQGHIDVVPGGSNFRVAGDKVFGRGSFDMLFGTASFMALIDSLDNPSEYNIGLLLTGDEEVGGENGVGTLIKDKGIHSSVCILPDAGEGIGSMNIAAKGILQMQIRITGKAHHASRPWEGDGAGNKLVALLAELTSIFDDSERINSTISISQIQTGGDAINQGPSEATAGFDIRTKNTTEHEKIKKYVCSIIKKYGAEITSEHNGRNYELNINNSYIRSFVAIYEEVIGKKIRYTKAHGSSDARFLDEAGIPVIMFRPDGGGAHGDNEWLSIESWNVFHQILCKYVIETAKIK